MTHLISKHQLGWLGDGSVGVLLVQARGPEFNPHKNAGYGHTGNPSTGKVGAGESLGLAGQPVHGHTNERHSQSRKGQHRRMTPKVFLWSPHVHPHEHVDHIYTGTY